MLGRALHRAVVACALLAASGTAHADGAPPPFFLNTSAPIPSDGAIVVIGQLPEPLTLTLAPAQASAAPVAAHVLRRGLHWAFIPDAALVPGEYQLAQGPGSFGTGFHDMLLTVIEPIGDAWPEFQFDPEPSAGVELNGYEDACCLDWNGHDLVETAQCYTSQSALKVMIDLAFVSPAGDSTANQFFVEAIPAGSAKPDFGKFPTDWNTLWFSEQQDEYCFEVHAMNIASGEEHTYDQLAGCVPHGDLPDLGGPTPEQPLFSRDLCKIPPVGFEATWCEQHESACLGSPEAVGCEYAGYVCRGEPLPMAMPMPTDEQDAGVVMTTTTDAAMTPEPAHAKGGCAIATQRMTRRVPPAIFIVAILALPRVRRRAR